MTLRQFYELRAAPELYPGATHQETRRLVGFALGRLQTFWGRDPTLDEIRRPLLKRFMAWLAEPTAPGETYHGRALPPSPEMARSTANRHCRHLLAVIHYAAEEELIRTLPRIRMLKVQMRRPRAWHVEHVSQMLDQAGRLTGSIEGVPASAWWTALILVLYDTGGRITAVMRLRWADYFPASRALQLRAETQKQAAEQLLGISTQAASALERLRTAGQDLGTPIFAWPYDRSSTGRALWKTLRAHFCKRILGPAGLPIQSGKVFHLFRRTNISLLRAAGADATAQAGHSSPAVTRLYEDPDVMGPLREADCLPRPTLADPQGRLF